MIEQIYSWQTHRNTNLGAYDLGRDGKLKSQGGMISKILSKICFSNDLLQSYTIYYFEKRVIILWDCDKLFGEQNLKFFFLESTQFNILLKLEFFENF